MTAVRYAKQDEDARVELLLNTSSL